MARAVPVAPTGADQGVRTKTEGGEAGLAPEGILSPALQTRRAVSPTSDEDNVGQSSRNWKAPGRAAAAEQRHAAAIDFKGGDQPNGFHLLVVPGEAMAEVMAMAEVTGKSVEAVLSEALALYADRVLRQVKGDDAHQVPGRATITRKS